MWGLRQDMDSRTTLRFLEWVTGWILNYMFVYGALKISLKWNTSLSFISM